MTFLKHSLPYLLLTGLTLLWHPALAMNNESDPAVRVLLVADQETTLASQLVGRVHAVNALYWRRLTGG